MSIKRTICGLEWRVLSPSLYVVDSFDDSEDCLAVYYDPAAGWCIADRFYKYPGIYPTRDVAMARIPGLMDLAHGMKAI